MRIEMIVITGAPCAGKTTALGVVKREIEALGWKVLTVAETATELKNGGVTPWECAGGVFQRCRLKLQHEKEEAYLRAAASMDCERVLIVCDRGALDTRCYVSAEQFAEAAASLGESETSLRDRYGAVFHLVTAAKGAPGAFVTGEGTVRRETPEEATAFDEKSIAAWCGHPHLRIIGCEENFEDKTAHLVKEIKAYLGEPEPYETERKFLVKYPDITKLEEYPFCRKVEIEQTYLRAEGARVRRRGANGDHIYFYTEKRDAGGIKRIEVEERITEEEYRRYLEDAEEGRGTVKKDRYCIVYKEKYFELDVYPVWRDRALLEIELASENEEFEIPDFIDVIREVTTEDEYKNYNIAKLFEA